MSTSARRSIWFVGVVATVLALFASSLSAPAYADTQSTKSLTLHQGYSKTVMTRFYSPNICVRTKFQGVINFRMNRRTWHRDIPNDTLYLYFLDRISLSNNTMTVTTFKPYGSTCTSTPKDYAYLSSRLKIREYSCSMNSSFSVGVPWSASYSFWPSCGNVNLAGWGDSDPGGHYFKMSHTNDYAKFSGTQSTNWSTTKRTNLTWGCYGVAATQKVKTATASDTRTTAKIKVCPTWNGSVWW